jgi:hypothetical protein
MAETRAAYKILVGKPEGNSEILILQRKCENNIKIGIKRRRGM